MSTRSRIGFLVLMTAVAVVAGGFLPTWADEEPDALAACKTNLKNLGTALEMWGVDHDGYYPDALGEIAPNYFRVMPTCPAAGRDTYTESYTQARAVPELTLYCSQGHYGAPEDRAVCERSLAQALEALGDYAEEHQGVYPETLAEVGAFQCPLVAAGKVKPHGGRKASDTFQYSRTTPAYTVYCSGTHHRTANYPSYDSRRGLVGGP